MFDAPRKDQQVWFVRRFGPDVNLSNIAPGEVLSLETLRLGLRSDTLGIGGSEPRRGRTSRGPRRRAARPPRADQRQPRADPLPGVPRHAAERHRPRAGARARPSALAGAEPIRSLWASDLSRAARDRRDRRREDRAVARARPAAARGQPRRVGGSTGSSTSSRPTRRVTPPGCAPASRSGFPAGSRCRTSSTGCGAPRGYPRRRRAARAGRVPRRQHPRDAVQPRSAGPRRVPRVRGPERGGASRLVSRLPVGRVRGAGRGDRRRVLRHPAPEGDHAADPGLPAAGARRDQPASTDRCAAASTTGACSSRSTSCTAPTTSTCTSSTRPGRSSARSRSAATCAARSATPTACSPGTGATTRARSCPTATTTSAWR